MQTIRKSVALGLAALLLAACGGSPDGGGQTSTNTDGTEGSHASDSGRTETQSPAPSEASTSENGTESSETESAEQAEPSTEDDSTDGGAPTNDDTGSGDDGEKDNSPILGEESKGNQLNLSDFFRPNESTWSENRYDVADKPDVSGIAGKISQCGNDGYSDVPELELRLANNFQELSFNAGQANDSESSKQTLVVKVVGNGGQIDIKRIPFNETASFKIPVKGVNSLIIQVYLDDEVRDCSSNGPAQAVLWGFELR